MSDNFEVTLAKAFPAEMIDRALIDEPTANWTVYDDRESLADFENKTWQELPAELLERHSTLPVYAGDALFHATLPGYLRLLLHERKVFNDLPFQIASQLTRKDDPNHHPKFDRRVARFTLDQRAAVRDVLAHLATVSPLEDTMSRALATWNNLERKERR
jgi:hypothetical protein